jgi:uncharacterized protein (DUF58 family)
VSGPGRPGALRTAARSLPAGLTVRGRAFLSSGVASGVCGMVLGDSALIRIAVLLIALPLVAMATIAGSRYRISCQRSLDPARVTAGSVAQIRLRLENTARLPSAPLLVEDQVPYAFGARPRFILRRIQPGAARTVIYRVRSDNRGRFPIGPLSLHSADPLGLFEVTRSFSTRHLLTVAPKTETLAQISLGTVWSGRGEGHAAHTAAAGEDDVGVREYRHGDELRRIHWPATAHRGEIMVRREEQTWHSRATILLDSRSGAHRGEGPGSSYEWAVSAAASTAIYLLRNGYTVHLSTGVGTAPILTETEDAVLETLALVQPVHTTSLRIGPDAGDEISESLVIAFLGELGDLDTAHLARAKPSGAGALAFLLDTSTWAPAGTSRGGRGHNTAEPWPGYELARDGLAASGWRVVPSVVGDRFAELWQASSRRAEPPSTGWTTVNPQTVPTHSVPAASEAEIETGASTAAGAGAEAGIVR